MPRIKLTPAGAGAWTVIVFPSDEERSVTTAEPIFTVLPFAANPLLPIVITSPADSSEFGYRSIMDTALFFGGVTISRTKSLLTSADVTQSWYYCFGKLGSALMSRIC